MKHLFYLIALMLSLAEGRAQGLATRFPVVVDTYLDSQSPSNNFGAASTIKVLVNSDGSVTRGMVKFPEVLSVYAPEDVLDARFRLYVWQDNTKTRDIVLYPLLRAFSEGTGAASSGATWFTYDGTNAWTSPGGDFDADASVTAVKEEVLDPGYNDRFFSWDLTALLADPAARSNLLAHGAMLIMSGEGAPPVAGSDRAPFTSAEAGGYTDDYKPHLAVTLALRDTRADMILVPESGLQILVTEPMPYLTHRVERTFDVGASNGWQSVYTFSGEEPDPQWIDAQHASWTSAFYRVVIEP